MLRVLSASVGAFQHEIGDALHGKQLLAGGPNRHQVRAAQEVDAF